MTAVSSKRPRSLLTGLVALCAAVVLLWALLELASWAVQRIYIAATSDQRDQKSQAVLIENLGTPLMHPLWAGFGDPPPGNDLSKPRREQLYDPFITHRFAPMRPAGSKLSTDRYGFIHNGDQNRIIDLSPDTVRVLLLGGSSMAGFGGVKSNDETIGGYLEQQLNALGDGHRYQVINAGINGFYSSNESVYFMTELVHYRPAVVVIFDGYNDFWRSWAAAKDSADRAGVAIPNRSAQQQKYVAFFAGLEQRRPIIEVLREQSAFTRVFRYSGDLLASVVVQFVGESPADSDIPAVPAAKDPWPENAAWLSAEGYGSTSHVPYMLANWRNIIGAASTRGMGIVLLLQPFIPVAGRDHTPVEKEQLIVDLDQFWAKRPHLDRAEYERLSMKFYEEARRGVAGLGENYSHQPLVHTEDVSFIFNDRSYPMFVDLVHLTSQANAILAEHIAAIVKRMVDQGAGGQLDQVGRLQP